MCVCVCVSALPWHRESACYLNANYCSKQFDKIKSVVKLTIHSDGSDFTEHFTLNSIKKLCRVTIVTQLSIIQKRPNFLKKFGMQ